MRKFIRLHMIVYQRILPPQSTNAKPKEVSSLQKNCKDDWNLHPSQLACGKQRNTMGEYVWDSQVSDYDERSLIVHGSHCRAFAALVAIRAVRHSAPLATSGME